MREDIAARFSASCFARWGLICISSAMMKNRGSAEVVGDSLASFVPALRSSLVHSRYYL